jgi:hypothetical protein
VKKIFDQVFYIKTIAMHQTGRTVENRKKKQGKFLHQEQNFSDICKRNFEFKVKNRNMKEKPVEGFFFRVPRNKLKFPLCHVSP